jgi:hypothetical protein
MLNVLTAQCNVVQKRRRVIPLGGVNFIIFLHHFSLFWCPLHVFEPNCMIYVCFNKLLVILNVLTAQCNVVQKRRRVIPLRMTVGN